MEKRSNKKNEKMSGELNNNAPKQRTVGDLYKEAAKMFIKEMETLKKRPLTKEEIAKAEELAVVTSNGILKQMRII